jgi:hypothetical protein
MKMLMPMPGGLLVVALMVLLALAARWFRRSTGAETGANYEAVPLVSAAA